MIQASLFLKNILNDNDDVVQACGDRIYPIAAPAGTVFPFVSFSHSSVADIGTKDGSVRTITADITFTGRTAQEVEELADSFLPAMFDYYENEGSDYFDEPEFVSEGEAYIEDIDAFAVNMKIKFETI